MQEDNRAMTEDRDLLPWILGALSMAAVAMAVAIGMTGRTTSAHASSQTPSRPPASAAPASTSPASTASSSAAQAQPALTQNAAGNQIWECTTNGVKTFSNTRCGSAAVLREVGPINVMEASPASNVHWYGAGPNDAGDYYDPSYDPNPPQPADNSYPVVVGVPYLERRRLERPRQAAHHDQGHHDQGHPRRN